MCLPVLLQVLGVLFSIDDLTGFEITKAIELPEPWGVVALWGLVFPSIFILANALTSLAFKDALIMKVHRARASARNFPSYQSSHCRLSLALQLSVLALATEHPTTEGLAAVRRRGHARTAAPAISPTSATS